jgi:phosphomannomutase
VHGASRSYLSRLLHNPPAGRLIVLRDTADPTFGGIAPEPSSTNMQPVMTTLAARKEPLKIGAIIDPDGDRIRFTDGTIEISMNQFGAMAYHFLHEIKGKRGMVAKTVASSNLANAVATQLGEEVFEPKVGFKEFKPVINKALVYFEESDGISIIGHTPEKDAFIGLILAIDMVLTLKKPRVNTSPRSRAYGHFYPDRDGVTVSQQGESLLPPSTNCEKSYAPGKQIRVGAVKKPSPR